MGKGDKKTRKGKIFRGSYGKRRPQGKDKFNKPADTADNK
ncbi:MAG: 30S ribosomal protein THX [Bacteroidales bacterium]